MRLMSYAYFKYRFDKQTFCGFKDTMTIHTITNKQISLADWLGYYICSMLGLVSIGMGEIYRQANNHCMYTATMSTQPGHPYWG